MELADLIDTVTGFGNGFGRVIEATGMTQEALNGMLLDHNVEKCPNCHWYTDSHHLLDDDGGVDGYCDNCRQYDRPAQQ
ncbi:hypothetical protein [Ralstonia insidiosa]|nr:hypothetical protein [Ralstonia insidiosa]MBA9939307.1 hypothetical protein [Ralstonia insidiosa]MBC9968080.1 hypothetical protein [Ralstonia insidiosa]MBX3904357.1 hypothetical protein [Ralstonia insidiosa]